MTPSEPHTCCTTKNHVLPARASHGGHFEPGFTVCDTIYLEPSVCCLRSIGEHQTVGSADTSTKRCRRCYPFNANDWILLVISCRMLHSRGEEHEQADTSQQTELAHIGLQGSEWVCLDPRLAARPSFVSARRLTFPLVFGVFARPSLSLTHTAGRQNKSSSLVHRAWKHVRLLQQGRTAKASRLLG